MTMNEAHSVIFIFINAYVFHSAPYFWNLPHIAIILTLRDFTVHIYVKQRLLNKMLKLSVFLY